MSASELLDTFDPSGRPLGARTREDIHREGLWHRVFHCLLVSGAGEDAGVLLQRRHPAKSFGGLYDLSATGHLLAGEEPIDGVRELTEELGVGIPASTLVPAGVRHLADDNGEGRNRELVHLYFARDDRPLADYRPQADEVSGLARVNIVAFGELCSAGVRVDAAVIDEGVESTTTLDSSDLVPGGVGTYWSTLSIMAHRFANGIAPLAI